MTIDNSFSDRILPTSGHYICGNGFVVKTEENNRQFADIHDNETRMLQVR